MKLGVLTKTLATAVIASTVIFPLVSAASTSSPSSHTIAANINSFEQYMNAGYAAAKQKNYQSAINYFKAALNLRPGDRYATQAISNAQNYLAKYTPSPQTAVEPQRIRVPYTNANRPSGQKSCDCPYDRAKNESLCGGRSAYARQGGNEPACYVGETTARQVWWNNSNNQFVDRQRAGK